MDTYTGFNTTKYEKEADLFAMELLVPDGIFLEYQEYTTGQIAHALEYDEKLIKLRCLKTCDLKILHVYNLSRKESDLMMYPFMTLDDETEIVHSEMKPDGRVKVYIEKPDSDYCFRHATCWLPDYTWEDVYKFSDEDIKRFQGILESTALIPELINLV